MSSPRNTNNSPNNPEYRKGGNPLGFILALLIFGGVIFGLYYLWKSKQAGNTSLNLNPNNQQQVQTDNTGTVPAQDNTNQSPQTQSYSNSNSNFNQNPNQAPPQKIRKQKYNNKQYNSPNNSGSLEHKTQLTYKSQDGKNRVLSGYGGSSEQNSNQANKNLIYILPQKFFPSNGIVPGSLQSLVTDHQNITNGLPRPDQLIYFATGFYEREEALKFATNKLKSLGFQRIRLASDQYRKGGQTVMEALDSKNNQIFFFFKPNNQSNQMTLWKAEIYSAHKLNKRP